MQPTYQHDHENKSTIDAMGADQQKLEFILNHVQQAKERGHHNTISESLAEIIRLSSTPEEIALAALAVGKAISSERRSPGELLGKLRAMQMLAELFEDLEKMDDDGPDTEE